MQILPPFALSYLIYSCNLRTSAAGGPEPETEPNPGSRLGMEEVLWGWPTAVHVSIRLLFDVVN